MSNPKTDTKHNVKVSIMRREMTVACAEDEKQGLVEAAAYLDKQMREIATGSQILGVDRCAIMAALNISHELLQLQKKTGELGDAHTRLQNLYDKVEQVMENIRSDGNPGDGPPTLQRMAAE